MDVKQISKVALVLMATSSQAGEIEQAKKALDQAYDAMGTRMEACMSQRSDSLPDQDARQLKSLGTTEEQFHTVLFNLQYRANRVCYGEVLQDLSAAYWWHEE